MNLSVTCKENNGQAWTYILADRNKMSQEDWTSQIKRHIQENNNQKAFQEAIKVAEQTVWYKHDTIEDFALQIYAAKYCTNVETKVSKKALFILDTVRDELGCEQLVFK